MIFFILYFCVGFGVILGGISLIEPPLEKRELKDIGFCFSLLWGIVIWPIIVIWGLFGP